MQLMVDRVDRVSVLAVEGHLTAMTAVAFLRQIRRAMGSPGSTNEAAPQTSDRPAATATYERERSISCTDSVCTTLAPTVASRLAEPRDAGVPDADDRSSAGPACLCTRSRPLESTRVSSPSTVRF